MTNEYTVIYSPAALDDLRSIYSYIAFELKAEVTAKKQVDRIRNQVRSLDCMPDRYPKVEWEPWASMGMRKVPINNYIIFYTVNTDTHTVTVVRIFYGGRDIKSIIQEEN